MTAIPVEHEAVRRHLADTREEKHERGTVYLRGRFDAPPNAWDIGLVEIGAGNEGAAAEAERAIEHFDPDVVLFVGVAGGLKDVQLGDVVAATKVYGYHAGKVAREFQPRPDVSRSSYALEQRARAEARKRDWTQRLAAPPAERLPRVFVAPIAAGEQVIASPRSATYRFLRSNYGDAVAVEMEGHGFLRAAYANQQVDALIVRGISDMVADKSHSDAHGWQEIAAEHAAAFAFEVLAKYEPDAPTRGPVVQ